MFYVGFSLSFMVDDHENSKAIVTDSALGYDLEQILSEAKDLHETLQLGGFDGYVFIENVGLVLTEKRNPRIIQLVADDFRLDQMTDGLFYRDAIGEETHVTA